MGSSMLAKVTCMAMICFVMGSSIMKANGEIPCGQVQLYVASCVGYLRSPGPSVPEPCCNGIRTVNSQSKTTADRQSVCNCLKSTALSFPGLNPQALAALPANCGVNLPYKISTSIDCNTIKY
ncbi:non-specific lipid-transfer protein 1 [Cicer arietinum]|uniref:Non-specific lipid-transfer protein n=1 Tax=Cicer arietinum TaxID=3827 RepID=A0A1S2XPK3_CICAR|nr:non-specific lipid-transfer protein 1 [Cicer arietinum]